MTRSTSSDKASSTGSRSNVEEASSHIESDAEGASSHNSDENEVCQVCGLTPCKWEEFGELLLETRNMYDRETQGTTGEVLDAAGDIVSSAKVRFALYSYFTYIKYGHLGRGNRPVPRCVKC